MILALRKFGYARLGASILFALMISISLMGVWSALNPRQFDFLNGLDLAGEWELRNGSIKLSEIRDAKFPEKVLVPQQLPSALRRNLANEFWYRKKFQLSRDLRNRELSFSLGSIKGSHEVYLNGNFLGGGLGTSFAVYRIPNHLVQAQNLMAVRIRKSDTIYAGIVHLSPIGIAESKYFKDHLDKYYFSIGLTPLIPSAFKFFLCIIFMSFFLISPGKREYFSFSVFLLFASFPGALYSRFMPLYQEFYLRSALHFLASTFALAVVPWLGADFCRLSDSQRSDARSFGLSLGIVFILAALIAKDRDAQLWVYELSYQWLPLVAVLPASILCAWRAASLDSRLLHRRIELALFSSFLFVGALSWSRSATAVFSFQKIFYPEFIDLMLVLGMGSVMLFNWRAISKRSDRIGIATPKWFSYFLASGLTEARIEVPVIALAVDTVGYTKMLSLAGEEKKDCLHAEIRDLLAPLVVKHGAQKLSDGGDGGIFAWDLPDDPINHPIWDEIVKAARNLSTARGAEFPITFRVGLAAGIVRGEMRGGDFSFMGEALNIAARLEAMSEPGMPLVDDSVSKFLRSKDLNTLEKVAQLKGVTYRGVGLKKAA